jgi:hypothetical protein
VLGVVQESPLAFRVTDMPGLYKSDHKVLAGLVLTGLAAFAYPSAQELDEDRLRLVAVAEFDAWLRDLCERLRSHDVGGEVIPEEGLDAAWRIYIAMPSLDRSEATGQPTNKCTRYWIRKMLTWLVGQGMARPDPLADDTWTLTERFRIHAREIALERAYSLVLPAIECYQFLLDGPRHWRRPDDSNRVGQSDYGDACAWLPSPLRPRAGELLASGEKIAQEHLGLQTLLRAPTLIAGLAS